MNAIEVYLKLPPTTLLTTFKDPLVCVNLGIHTTSVLKFTLFFLRVVAAKEIIQKAHTLNPPELYTRVRSCAYFSSHFILHVFLAFLLSFTSHPIPLFPSLFLGCAFNRCSFAHFIILRMTKL
jgi:hypothetical protein